MSIKLHIPSSMESVEAACCQRARTVRRWSWPLNLSNIAIIVGDALADHFFHKTLPTWFFWSFQCPLIIVVWLTLLCPHWLAARLSFIPETPPPTEER